MRVRFKWLWDEELDGDALESGAARARGRRLLWAILLLGAVIAAAFYWQQARRVQQQEEVIKGDVSASYRLWRDAVDAGDLELFLFQLSNQDATWQNGQRELFLQQRLLDRPELELAGPQHVNGEDVASVEIAPDWQSATLYADFTYDAGGNGSGSLPLRQTYFFRKHGERWLMSPGDDEFWGAQQRTQLDGLTLFYPERDAQLAIHIGRDLWDDIRDICGGVAPEASDACLKGLQISVRFEQDPRLRASLSDSFTPLFRGGDFVLPTPTLVGLPQNDAAYQLLYEGYTSRILSTLRQNLSPPLALPEQSLQVLCFPAQGRSLQLFRYDALADSWTAELTGRSFRYLMPGPRGDGVILQDFTRGSEAMRLRLYWWRDGREQLIYDQEMQDQTRRPAGWSGVNQPRLLLQEFSGDDVSAHHLWLDLERCDEDGCDTIDLPGYTVWSPGGSQTLVLHEQMLWRGDEQGQPLVPLGAGLSPFWLDEDTYGYVRYDREAGSPSMQIATGEVGNDLPQIVMAVSELAKLLDPANPPLLFINYVAVNPADSDQLLLSATTVGAVSSASGATAKYNIFSLRLSTGRAQLLLQFERLPTGYPSLLTPAGYPPLRLSPDGRWLLVTLLASSSPTTWSFQLYDLQEQRALEVNTYYPEYPAQFPFYEWTPDGRWLAVVEDGFLRLIAPGYNYQKLVTHRFDDCFYLAWVS